MSLFNHILIATCYTLVAAAVAIALPYGFSAIDLNAAIVVGGVVLVGSALLHEVFARQDGEAKLADALQALRLDHGDARRELDQSRNRLRSLQGSLDQVVVEHKTLADEHRNFETVVAEVKVLQGLIEQLSARTKGKAAPKRDAARAPAPTCGPTDSSP